MENPLAVPDMHSRSANTIFLSIVAALTMILCIVPFISLYRVRNISACTMITVVWITNLFTFINAILWPNDDTQTWFNGNGLCDVEIYIRIISATLITTSTAGIMRNLAQALDADNPRLYESRSMRRRRIFTDIVLVFGVPFLQLVLHYTVQSARYAIITTYGCIDELDDSWPSIVIFLIWPPIFVLLNCYYGCLVVIRLRKHRGRLSSTLSSSGSGFNARRFMKLFFMSFILLVIYLPITIAVFVFNLPLPMQTYNWSRVHNPSTWNEISFLTSIEYPRVPYYGWLPIIMGVCVFIFYGMNNEAIELYRAAAIKCGFGKLFPSLLLPKSFPRRGSAGSGGSWISRFDGVSKALNYFDGIRKPSTAGTSGTFEELENRKGSSATTDTGFGGSRNNSSDPAIPKYCKTSKTSAQTPYRQDFNSPAPVLSTYTISQSNSSGSVTVPSAPRGIFSIFRINMNLPFFSKQSLPPPSTTFDLEQASPTRRRPSHQPHPSLDNATHTVSTNIWSGTDDDEDVDPLTPRIGSRAFRERERREMLAESKGKKEGVIVSKFVDQHEESSAS